MGVLLDYFGWGEDGAGDEFGYGGGGGVDEGGGEEVGVCFAGESGVVDCEEVFEGFVGCEESAGCDRAEEYHVSE